MGWNPLNDLRYSVEKERALLGDDPLNEGAGLWNNIMGSVSGATDGGVQSKKDAITEEGNRKKYEAVIESLEGTYTPGMSAGDLEAQKTRLLQRAYEKSPAGLRAAAQERRLDNSEVRQTTQLEQQGKRLDASIAATKAGTAESARQFDVTQAGSRADRIAERADKADDRIAQLELAEMRLAAEDRRYEEQWLREDKKERAALIAQLFSGIGQTAQFI